MGLEGVVEEVGMREVVSRVKYSWSSWGRCDLAEGLSELDPVDGCGSRDATPHISTFPTRVVDEESEGVVVNLRPALEGAGFSGIEG